MSFIKRIFFRFILLLIIVPVLLVLFVRFFNPITTCVILQHNWSRADDVDWMHIKWIDYPQMSKAVPLAVLAAEDQRFPSHFGIDFTELRNALQSSNGKIRGASTITQQVAKNLFLWHGRSIFRKILEAYFAVLMELLLPKERILELYLNVAQMGPTVYGIEQAANTYFNKSASNLNLYESARIAAVLPNPVLYSVVNTSDYVLQRQQRILQQTKRLGGYAFLDKLN